MPPKPPPTYEHRYEGKHRGKTKDYINARCRVLTDNGILAQIEFADGVTAVVQRYKVRRAKVIDDKGSG